MKKTKIKMKSHVNEVANRTGTNEITPGEKNTRAREEWE